VIKGPVLTDDHDDVFDRRGGFQLIRRGVGIGAMNRHGGHRAADCDGRQDSDAAARAPAGRIRYHIVP
jgi:hypothetical protein